MRFIIVFCALFPFSLLAMDITFDAKNIYFSSEHFRVIAGIDKKADAVIHDLAQKMLEAGEKSWHVQIESIGFFPPNQSFIKRIDIYIADTLAYNYETNSHETISSNFAGWVVSYPDNNSHFLVLNKTLTDNQLKVTIAHEFFHAVQYSYFDSSSISDKKWFANIWWLEATAVLLEDEVYDEINNYVDFLAPFFTQSYKNIEIYDGSHEYAMVIYAKYIKEKYGFDIIKESLKRYQTSEDKGFFEIIDDILKESYQSSMGKMLLDFSRWVYAPQLFFKDGNIYPLVQKSILNTTSKIEKGGVLILERITQYAVVSHSLYGQCFAQDNYSTIANNEDVLVNNFSSYIVRWEDLSKNILDETYFSQEYAYYKYDTYTNNYFWSIGDFSLPKDIFIQEITVEQKLYEKNSIIFVTRQKIEL